MKVSVTRCAASAMVMFAALVQGASAAVPHNRRVPFLSELSQPGALALARARAQLGGGRGNDQTVELADRFDRDANGRLDSAERREARLEAERLGLNRTRGRGRGAAAAPTIVTPGPKVSPESVRPYPSSNLYDVSTLRTFFLDFDSDEWEQELMAFKRTDIDVPARLTVDGRRYEDVGIQFHGNSSFSSVPVGRKHSMRIDVEAFHDKQDIAGYNTFLLLNAHEDPTFLRTVLYMQIARHYGAAPKANFVHVVINGESWGIYVNQQHFNSDLLEDSFGTRGGTRWKVPGSPGSRSAGLNYLGDDPAAYRSVYEIKTDDDPQAWEALITLTRTLEQTPPDKLEAALAPLLDIERTLKFLALDNVLVNGDGYWTRASDYSLYRAPDGRFQLLPYDVNSSFALGGGRGFGGRGGSPELDPLVAAGDPLKPLISRLLAVPSLRTRYLAAVREIAERWLDWRNLGPVVEAHRALISAHVLRDQRKLDSSEEFEAGAATLKDFADRRRAFLLATTAK